MQKLSNWLNKSTKYLLAAVMLAVPLYPKFPFLKIPGTYVSIRLEDFLIATLTLVLFITVFPRLKEILTDKINRKFVIYLLVGLVSLASGVFLTKTVVPSIGFLHWVRRIEYFVPFFAGYLLLKRKDPGKIDFFLKILVVTTFLIFIYGFSQKHFGWPVIITQNNEYSKGIALLWTTGAHINSTFAGHYDMASYLVIVMPIIISAFFVMKGLKTKIVLFMVFLSGLWLLSNSVSRISVASYLIGATLSLLILKKFKAILLVLAVSIVFFGLSSDLIARYARVIEVAKKQLGKISIHADFSVLAAGSDLTIHDIAIPTPIPTSIPVFEDRSTSIRLNVEWPRAIRALAKNPLLGTGYSSITLATDNDFLRLLGETGILGFISFMLIFATIGAVIIKALPFNNYEGAELAFLAGFIGSLPGVFLNASFIDIFEASKFAIIFWLLLGYSVYLVNGDTKE